MLLIYSWVYSSADFFILSHFLVLANILAEFQSRARAHIYIGQHRGKFFNVITQESLVFEWPTILSSLHFVLINSKKIS